MNPFSAETFAAALAIIGVVIIVSALLSGLIERSGLPQVAVFLALGAALGPAGLGLLDLSLDSAALRVVATLSLALVLFTDAVTLNIAEVKGRGALAFRLLGPGTLLTAALTTLAAWRLLDLPPAGAAILGAALASTDPVLLRGLLRRRDIPADARHALQMESGLNDAVLLPIVIVAIAVLDPNEPLSGRKLTKLGLELFILGPGAGILIGLLGVAALDLIRKRIGVRRDYESLYSLGVAFAAFAAAEAVHGSGFLAAFTAGATIAALDLELCDCFVEYGEVTAEMLLLFTFVLLGGSLIWSGFAALDGPTLLFTFIALLLRPPIYLLSLLGSNVDTRGRLLIAWFGPRGLSSLLLILLPVFAGLPGSDRLFALCSLVVLISVVLHGSSPMLLARIARRRAMKERGESGASDRALDQSFEPPGARSMQNAQRSDSKGAALPLIQPPAADDRTSRITLDELRRLQESGAPIVLLDVRAERNLDGRQAKGAVRLPPDRAVERAQELGLTRDAWLIAYCA
ncbi:MAG: cation:proton antiporter [Pyrinomonas methylaliphatogenes]|nr:cation:proton antiporter [Pyrinomonas methylaliphatogenes]